MENYPRKLAPSAKPKDTINTSVKHEFEKET
jgi:hypothetical protein